jgi:hypothetical protein
MTDLLKLILGVLAALFKSRARLAAEILVLRQQINVLRRGHRGDRTSKIPIGFCSFGSIAGAPLSLARLRLSGRKPSFAGIVLGFGLIGAGGRAAELADQRSRLSYARLLAR